MAPAAERRCRRAALFLAVLALAAPAVHALSWPLCEDGGQVWVTERPFDEPTFPGANLWFFCENGLNLLGVSVSDCIQNGTVCTPAIPDALCQAIGFDRAVIEDVHITTAQPQEVVRSLTGEYCVRQGQYSDTLPEADLGTLPGEPCRKIKGLTCIRTRETIVTALDASILQAFESVAPAAETMPPGSELTPADIAAESAAEAESVPSDTAVPAEITSAEGGGRRLRSSPF